MSNSRINGVNPQQLGGLLNILKEHPDASEAKFFVKTEWTCQDEGESGGFYVRSSCKDFQLGGQTIQRNNTYAMVFDFPPEFSGEGKGPTLCEACMSSLGACITQTIVAHATAREIIDSVTIDLEGNVDLQGFTGLSTDTRPGAQGFQLNVNIKSSTASKEQISQLYEIGKRYSPAFDTLTNGTSVIAVNSS